MAKFITLGVYTAKGLGGFVNNPSTDRKAATSALAAAGGAKVTRYAGLRESMILWLKSKVHLNKLQLQQWLLYLVAPYLILLF